MENDRRWFVAGALAAAGIPVGALARSSFPERPIRWLVGFPPGGGSTIVSRLVAQRLGQKLGGPVIVENRPGASGNLAVHDVAASTADGHTLVLIGASSIIHALTAQGAIAASTWQIEPVAGLVDFTLALVVHPTVPARSIAEFVAYGRQHPGGLNVGSFGVGSTSHLAGEMFRLSTGIDWVHVPYPGEQPALTDLIAGRVQAMFAVLTSALPHIQSGGLRALGVTGPSRSPKLGDVPTIGEAVPNYTARSWAGVGVARGTPAAIVEQLNSAINDVLSEPDVARLLGELGAVPLVLPLPELRDHVATETARWREVVERAGMRPR